jgi:hypothetical protein
MILLPRSQSQPVGRGGSCWVAPHRQGHVGSRSAQGRVLPSAPGKELSVCITVTVRIRPLPEFIDANTATEQLVVEPDPLHRRMMCACGDFSAERRSG